METFERWASDPGVTDILLNGWDRCFVERAGVLEPQPSPFADPEGLWNWLERVCVALGARFDARHPYLEGVWEGMRIHVVLPPIAPDGPLVSLRRPAAPSLTLEDFGEGWAVVLRQWVRDRKNVLVAGATGSGKTTLLTRLLEEVAPEERIVVLEDSPELALRHPHVVHLLTRKGGPEQVGEVSLKALLRHALRMRPDRLLVGEVRGGEAWDLLQAMNTGHRGAMTTLHGNSSAEALSRLEALASGESGIPAGMLRRWVRGALNGVVFLEREGGKRRVREVVEIIGSEGDQLRLEAVRPACRRWGSMTD